MGYRSEVYMAIDAHDGTTEEHGGSASGSAQENFFRFKAMADAAGLTPTQEQWGDGGEEGIGWTQTSFDFKVSSVKWYPSFPEIQQMEAFFNLARRMNDEGTAYLSGAFVRIGEDHGDVETQEFGDIPPSVYVVSHISADRDFNVFGDPYVPPETTKQTEEV